ncbi:hypothetical protein [Specibacter sp. NPDC078692]|uniref:hypothetical protein n=1 Tax=Specibacter sp. NPDC078692 TaxID=3155818 RepID=UPI00342A5CDF
MAERIRARVSVALPQRGVLAVAVWFYLTMSVRLNQPNAWAIFALLVVASAFLALAVGQYSLKGLRKPKWVLLASLAALVLAVGLGTLG